MRTENKIPIISKWKFVGCEIYKNAQWQESHEYTPGMTWRFMPQYFTETKIIGTIVESRPNAAPVELNYLYLPEEKVLQIEVYSDDHTDFLDESEVDAYQVIFTRNADGSPNVMKLNILNQQGCPPPYLRYLLQVVK